VLGPFCTEDSSNMDNRVHMNNCILPMGMLIYPELALRGVIPRGNWFRDTELIKARSLASFGRDASREIVPEDLLPQIRQTGGPLSPSRR